MGHDGAQRGWRTIRPNLIHRIALHRNEGSALVECHAFHPVDLTRRMKPGVESEANIASEIFREPGLDRLVGQMDRHDQVRIHLLPGLQRVTAIDEQRRPVSEDDRQPGRAGEAGQPGKPFGLPGHELALMSIRARHHHPVEPVRLEHRAQRRKPPCGRGRYLQAGRVSGPAIPEKGLAKRPGRRLDHKIHPGLAIESVGRGIDPVDQRVKLLLTEIDPRPVHQVFQLCLTPDLCHATNPCSDESPGVPEPDQAKESRMRLQGPP